MATSPGTYKGQTITAGSDADIQKQIEQIDLSSGTIDSKTLAPTTEMTVTQPKTPTRSDGLIGELSTRATNQRDAYTEELAQRAEALRGDASQAFDMLMSNMTSLKGAGTLRDREYSRTVDPAKAELNDINQQILEEQVGLQRRLEAIDKRGGGLESGALIEKQQIKDESLRRQADLSIVQLARQGRYDSAKEIADRAVSARLEQQTILNEALKFNYLENKDLFTQAEQRLFETQQADRERRLNFEEYKMKTQYDQLIAQNDPLYKIQLAKAQKELSLLGEPTAEERKASEASLKEAQASLPVMRDKIMAVDTLKSHYGMGERVGANALTRGTALPFIGDPNLFAFGGEGEDFAGGIHKLVGGLTIDNLMEAKARGATFGALSDSELMLLAQSASAISDWEVKDGKGRGTGYWDIDEASFNREMDRIKELTQRAITLSGNSLIAPEEQALLDSILGESSFDPSGYYSTPSSI